IKRPPMVARLLCSNAKAGARLTLNTDRLSTGTVWKWQIPRFINTDKAPAYGRALALLKREGRCPSDVEHRQIKYRNNVIECDHGKLKRIIGATLGFKSMKTAYATIKGIEVMRALRKGQASAFYYGDPLGEMRLVSRVFEM
ncbi:DDE-type integrase/transposase/recombinase, partial [Klebsiella pneumoniae]|uniref:DDE-type integrase/transposase/recombinase n=1 Tax=Klebsiella pneumoniae TaxID=573 RepID=UPI00287006EC